MLKFTLIILNWNNCKDTLECLASIDKIKYPNFEVIVVDNGSTDDSIEIIRTRYPQHTMVENKENLGFAEGNNRGLREGIKQGAEMLMLLNNDTIIAPNMLTEISKAALDHPQAGAFGPKIYFYDDPATIWYAGGGVDQKTGRCYHIGCGSADMEPKYKQSSETEYICGCAIAIRSQVIQSVGLLDPEFFLTWEEIDWCYRMRKSGFSCLFVPEAKVWHKVSASFVDGNWGPMWQYFYFRNRLLFHKRHFSFARRWRKAYISELVDLIKTSFHPNPFLRKQHRAALSGVCDYFLGRFGKGRLSKFTQK